MTMRVYPDERDHELRNLRNDLHRTRWRLAAVYDLLARLATATEFEDYAGSVSACESVGEFLPEVGFAWDKSKGWQRKETP